MLTLLVVVVVVVVVKLVPLVVVVPVVVVNMPVVAAAGGGDGVAGESWLGRVQRCGTSSLSRVRLDSLAHIAVVHDDVSSLTPTTAAPITLDTPTPTSSIQAPVHLSGTATECGNGDKSSTGAANSLLYRSSQLVHFPATRHRHTYAYTHKHHSTARTHCTPMHPLHWHHYPSVLH